MWSGDTLVAAGLSLVAKHAAQFTEYLAKDHEVSYCFLQPTHSILDQVVHLYITFLLLSLLAYVQLSVGVGQP